MYIFIALFAWFVESLSLGILNGATSAIVISAIWLAIMAIFIIPLDYSSTSKLPSEALNVNQERYILVQGKIEEVFFSSYDILKSFSSCKKIKQSKEKLTITAKTKMTSSSCGENIALKFEQLSNDSVRIHIKSYPVSRFTLLDFGKNFANIEYLSKEIKKLREFGGHNTGK